MEFRSPHLVVLPTGISYPAGIGRNIYQDPLAAAGIPRKRVQVERYIVAPAEGLLLPDFSYTCSQFHAIPLRHEVRHLVKIGRNFHGHLLLDIPEDAVVYDLIKKFLQWVDAHCTLVHKKEKAGEVSDEP